MKKALFFENTRFSEKHQRKGEVRKDVYLPCWIREKRNRDREESTQAETWQIIKKLKKKITLVRCMCLSRALTFLTRS